MIHRYKSDYPNQVHQLVVSVSRHMTITKDRRLRFQKKPIDVTLSNVVRSDREHVAYYIIRDHFSGVFYGEICSASALIPVQNFLLRAWSKKIRYLFCGAPDYISIPKTVSHAFPDLLDIIADCGIGVVEVTSGFQGEVRDIRTWERYLRQYSSMGDDAALLAYWSTERTCKLSAYINGNYNEPDSNIRMWYDNVKVLKLPTGNVWNVPSEAGVES